MVYERAPLVNMKCDPKEKVSSYAMDAVGP